jgi:hypothetical protein
MGHLMNEQQFSSKSIDFITSQISTTLALTREVGIEENSHAFSIPYIMIQYMYAKEA